MPTKHSLSPDFEIELIQSGKYSRIIGMDEAGRGCWAGPVYLSAYFIESISIQKLEGITDSKLLSHDQRLSLFETLKTHTHLVKIGQHYEIDQLGMGKLLESLITSIVNEYDDGNTLFLIDGQFNKDFSPNARKIIKGDLNYYSIAAASIIAKVSRDLKMIELAEEHQGYGFEAHKGYGTKAHQEAIAILGPSVIHRRSYKPFSQTSLFQ